MQMLKCRETLQGLQYGDPPSLTELDVVEGEEFDGPQLAHHRGQRLHVDEGGVQNKRPELGEINSQVHKGTADRARGVAEIKAQLEVPRVAKDGRESLNGFGGLDDIARAVLLVHAKIS